MPKMQLIDGLPIVHVGKPDEDRHGLRVYPVAVVRQDGAWLAIGYAKHHRRWPVPDLDCGPVPSVEVRIALERTVAILVGDANRLIDDEAQDLEALRAIAAEVDRIDRQAEKIRTMRDAAEARRSVISDRMAARW